MKNIYLIRHSGPFIEIDNYSDYKNVPWNDYNRNMILSPEGEDNAKALTSVEDFKNLDLIYSADSYRAIGTAKYIADINNKKIILDSRINERELGVDTISELPDNFSNDSFVNKDIKYKNGESLNEVDSRFNSFMNEILNKEENNIALFIHGMLMLSYLQNNFEFEFDGKRLKLSFNDNVIYDNEMKTPMAFKIIFDNNNNIVDIKSIY